MTTATANKWNLDEFAADGTRLYSTRDECPTKAGFRDMTRRECIARGASDKYADWLASISTTTKRRGTIAFRKGGTESPLSRRGCELLGMTPGPGNV